MSLKRVVIQARGITCKFPVKSQFDGEGGHVIVCPVLLPHLKIVSNQ